MTSISSSSSSSKFINKKEDAVSESIDGLILLNSNSITRIKGTSIVMLKNPNHNQVSIICGGGSGHEPAHAGYVTPGMLTAAVCGGVFASPSHKEVLTAILNVPNTQGVLLLIKNYTGDIINFELAAQLARSRGINVECVHVGEDKAFDENKRGLAGTVLLYKILGAAATSSINAQGMNLQQLKQLGDAVVNNLQTLGVSLSSCSLPGNHATFSIPEGFMEIGLGIHGEKGRRREELKSSCQTVTEMLEFFEFPENISQQINSEFLVLLNNLGSTTDLEMNIIAKDLLVQLKQKGIIVSRAVVGKIMTSLEMHGFSVTILPMKIKDKNNQKEIDLTKYIDFEIDSQHWKTLKYVSQDEQEISTVNSALQIDIGQKNVSKLVKESNHSQYWLNVAMKDIFTCLISKCSYFNELDAEVGDGDTGEGVVRSATACLEIIDSLDLENNLSENLTVLGELIADSFGGTSGPLYGVFLSTAGGFLKKSSGNTPQDYFTALSNGLQKLQYVGQSQKGDRTMVDVLVEMKDSFEEIIQNKSQGKEDISARQIGDILLTKAKQRSLEVANLKAKKGRSRYLDGREIGKLDPGCELVVAWMEILVKHL